MPVISVLITSGIASSAWTTRQGLIRMIPPITTFAASRWPGPTGEQVSALAPVLRHVYDQMGTYYQRGGRVITTPDGERRQAMTEVGSLSTTLRNTLHTEEGTTDPPLKA